MTRLVQGSLPAADAVDLAGTPSTPEEDAAREALRKSRLDEARRLWRKY